MADYADDVGVSMRQLGRPAVLVTWGIGALAALMYAQHNPSRVLGLVLLAPSPPADALPRHPEDHELRAVPAVYDAAWWGWTGTTQQLRERMPDMDEHDITKMTELLDGARESGLARRQRMEGIAIDAAALADIPVTRHRGRTRRRHPPQRDAPHGGPPRGVVRVLPVRVPLRPRHGGAQLARGRRQRARLARGAPSLDDRRRRHAGRGASLASVRAATRQNGLKIIIHRMTRRPPNPTTATISGRLEERSSSISSSLAMGAPEARVPTALRTRRK